MVRGSRSKGGGTNSNRAAIGETRQVAILERRRTARPVCPRASVAGCEAAHCNLLRRNERRESKRGWLLHIDGHYNRAECDGGGIAKKLPRYPVVPAVLLGRLAVERRYQGQGLGGILLADALMRTARAELGVFAMVVDAKDEAAQSSYEHYGFTVLPGEARRLCLPIVTVVERLLWNFGP